MTTPRIISVFTDCSDANVTARQLIRYQTLFPGAIVNCFAISNPIEAAGCILDVLDAGRLNPDVRQIIVGNVAPRAEAKGKYKNGHPFSYIEVDNNLVIGTLSIFALLKQFDLVHEVHQTDVYDVCSKFVSLDEAERIAKSQFRSYEYLPLLAQWIEENKEIPAISTVTERLANYCVWYVDNFGNYKTTATEPQQLSGIYAKLPFYEQLKDVPVGEAAITRGSSGFGQKRFLEIVVQGKSAAKKFNLAPGDLV